jgi:hypothetical protein
MALVVAVALLLVPSDNARAATTVGRTFTLTSTCTGSTLVQKSEGPGVPSYAVPAGGGVLISFSTMASSAPMARMNFKVFRPTGAANEYTIVAATATVTLTPSGLNTLSARIPVNAGDRLGIYGESDAPCNAASSGSEFRWDGGDFASGTTHTYSQGTPNNGAVDVSAQVEPDADRDAFGDETQDVCWTDPSTQATCPAPTIAGTAQAGQTLTGTPNGAPMTPAYRWLRCDAGGEGCTVIPGETGTIHDVTVADQSHTLRFRKTATNAGGSQTSDSAPTGVVPALPVPPPVLSRVSMTRTRFAVAAFATPVAALRIPRGSAFRYTLSVAASVRLRISAVLPGRRSGRRCLPPSRRLMHNRRCTRLALKRTLRRHGHAGRNTVRFSGKIGTRALKPGRYQARITATAESGASTPRTLRFTIVKG